MLRPVSSLSRLLSHLRWLYMPLGLFALVAVGVHAGAAAARDGALVGLDWLDGLSDRALASLLAGVGRLVSADPATIDRWIVSAVGFVDLRERDLLARWAAVLLELGADLVLALPALGYRERKAEEAKRETEKQQRLAQLVAEKLEARHPGVRPVPAAGGVGTLLRESLRDPTLLRWLLPVATACVAVAGACRIATEMQSIAFTLGSRALPAETAGNLGRALALFVLGGILLSLGARAVLQSLWWAHRQAELSRAAARGGVGRRLDGWLRLAVAGPLALAAAFYGAPLLSFFR